MRYLPLLLLLISCANQISPNEMAFYESLCKNNDGTHYVDINSISPDAIRCNNGALFTAYKNKVYHTNKVMK